jgi:hypothetical protein
MTLRHRLRRLEQEYRAGGRCPRCRARPVRVLHSSRQEAPEETPTGRELGRAVSGLRLGAGGCGALYEYAFKVRA